MNVQMFGITVWGNDPPLPLEEAIKQQQLDLERKLINAELDHIDMGARKEALRLKIAFLRNYSGHPAVQTEGVLKQIKQQTK